MAFQNGFNGALSGFQYITDSQDRLRGQRIQDDAIAQQKQTYADTQQRQAQDDEFAKVGRISALIASAPTPQARAMIYGSAKGSLAGFAQQHGLPLPEQWDESLLDEVQQMAQMLGASKGEQPNKWQNLGDGWVMDGQGNPKQIYQKQEKADWGYVPDPNNPNNEVYARREGNSFYDLNGHPLYGGGGGGGGGAVAAPSGDAFGQLMALSSQSGVTPTSWLRSPSHNAEVGGKPNSQHMAGTAMDYPVPQAQKAAFRALVEKNPDLEVIDEGDHMHVQRRKAGPRPAGGTPGSRPRYKPGAEGGQYAMMTPDEVKAMGLPAGTVAQRGPTGQVQIVNKPRDLPGAQGTVTVNEDGSTTFTPAGKTTEDQNKAAGWYRSSQVALGIIQKVAKEDPAALVPGVVETYGAVDEIKQRSRSANRQKVEQAYSTLKMDFLHAATGAGFTAQEAADEWRAISPQRGDSEELIAQKLEMAQTKLESMRMRAGGALPQPSATPAAAPASNVIRYDNKGNRIK